jgi:superfamily I DNA/RNA helicase
LLSLLSLRKGQHPDFDQRLQSGELSVSDEELQVFRHYTTQLRELGLCDLDDLLLRALHFIEAGTAQRQFRFIAVDEYQDVSATQRALVVALGRTATVLAIGDPDQAIYSFRGGEVRHFLGFCDDFPSAQSRYLVENYRSTPQIVAASAAVIAHNPAGRRHHQSRSCRRAHRCTCCALSQPAHSESAAHRPRDRAARRRHQLAVA